MNCLKKMVTFTFLFQCTLAIANPMQALMGANLLESSSFNFYGNADLDVSKQHELPLRPYKRDEAGFETNISLHRTKNSKLFFMANANTSDLGNDFSIGEHNILVKSRLSEAAAGFGYSQKNHDQTRFSLSTTFGSASDKLFSDSRDSNIEATGSYALAPKDQGQFILLLNYSNNRTFLNNVPIPFFAYIHRYSKKLILTAGLPFVSLSWFDIPRYTFNLFASPGGYGIEGSKYLRDELQLYLSFNSRAKTFKHSNRLEDKRKIILEDKKLMAGLKSIFTPNISLSLAAGLSFDRFIYEGESIFKRKGNQLRQQNDFFLHTRVALTFF